MLSWPNYIEWLADNKWQSLATVPLHTKVDVFVFGLDDSRPFPDRPTGRRLHGCVWDGRCWQGVPSDQSPQAWAPAMSNRRIRERTLL